MGDGFVIAGSSLSCGVIHFAFQSGAVSNPISQYAGSLHPESLPRLSQTSTCQ